MRDTQLSPSEPSISKPESICVTFTPISFLQADAQAAAKANPSDGLSKSQCCPPPSALQRGQDSVSLTTTASLARKVPLRCYNSFTPLLPRALSYSCKGPQTCINWSHVEVQSSRSMSSVSTVTTVRIAQLKYMFCAGPHSQPHLTITWPNHHQHGKEDGQWEVINLEIPHTCAVVTTKGVPWELSSCRTGSPRGPSSQDVTSS